ncbi:hypothetical protein FM113_15135 [Leucobacter sp. 7(1)]|uniref:hypothetical protein n=1 Tax=Leucobacter sp. 7(1) TaxID=1255613 RepID=UPI00097E935E|nr:hypothetical protein [Leucobacter sp. 7(1)]SJN12527.1 hypothetical protein FM113_15135 [Leucobacter sp. 7(1)]
MTVWPILSTLTTLFAGMVLILWIGLSGPARREDEEPPTVREELEDLYYGAKRLWKRFARRIFSIGKRDPGTQEENE